MSREVLRWYAAYSGLRRSSCASVRRTLPPRNRPLIVKGPTIGQWSHSPLAEAEVTEVLEAQASLLQPVSGEPHRPEPDTDREQYRARAVRMLRRVQLVVDDVDRRWQHRPVRVEDRRVLQWQREHVEQGA